MEQAFACLSGTHFLSAFHECFFCQLFYPVFCEAQDPVTNAKGGRTVRYDQYGLVGQLTQPPEQKLLCCRIQRAGRFVKDEYGTIGKNSTRNGDALHLTFRKSCAAFS